jgi:hypothetical protein
MNWKISRRQVIIAMATLAGGLGLTGLRRILEIPLAEAQGAPDHLVYLPYVAKPGDVSTAGKVVHVHSAQATSWDFGNNYYGNSNYVNQNIVNSMVDNGVKSLTGASSVAQAWQSLVPNYVPGKAIAIKVNFNNWWWCDRCSTNCPDWQLKIDALIHPINAVVRGLLQAYPSFNLSDIWVYDATQGANPSNDAREIPDIFKNGCLHTGVRFFGHRECNEMAGYSSTDPSGSITWHNPPGVPAPPTARVTDVLVNASYLINMPILKSHGGAGITLSFKNHFGSLANVNPLHDYVYDDGAHYAGTAYNPLVDIYRNPHILDKTVLTLGDCLYGNWYDNVSKPRRWFTFGNGAPNSLFFSKDPVAIDCVMCDLLAYETTAVPAWADDYLVIANNVGLGVYERGNPWAPSGSGYSVIKYQKIEL